MLIKLLGNKVFNYVFSRYAIYVLQFVNTLVLAKRLSPYEFGVWGFVQMILIYFSHLDLGIPSSFNALASIHIRNTKFVSLNFNAAITLIGLICLLVLGFFFFSSLFGFSMGTKYGFSTYMPYVLGIIALAYFNKLMTNLFRVYNRIREITFYQASIPISIAVAYLLFDKDLIQYLLIAMIAANSVSLLLFLNFRPFKLSLSFSKRLLIQIQKSGLFFFIYNASFYFTLLSTRSLISHYYSVEEFGEFNFAYSLSNSIEMTISAFVFLIFPKMINRLAIANNEDAQRIVNFMQHNYSLLVSLLTYLAIGFFPLVLYIYPKYINSFTAFSLILLTNLVYASCFGSPILLMARRREKKIAILAFFVLIMNITITFILILIFKPDYGLAVIGTTISYLIYIVAIQHTALIELNAYKGVRVLISTILPIRHSFPLLVAFVFSVMDLPMFYYWTPFFLFVALNYNYLRETQNNLYRLLKEPDLVNI